MQYEYYVYGLIAFSITKKVVVLSTINLYGVNRIYRHLLKLKRNEIIASQKYQAGAIPLRAQVFTTSTRSSSVSGELLPWNTDPWNTNLAKGFKVRDIKISNHL